MLAIDIPGFAKTNLQYLVLDYNGTMASDGEILPGVLERLHALSKKLAVIILTADTYGTVQKKLKDHPFKVTVLSRDPSRPSGEDEIKLIHVESLDPATVVFIGNGRNDAKAVKEAAIGIAVSQSEGASPLTLLNADIITPSITTALDLLLNPTRLTATLRL